MDHVEKARSLFLSGANCAQAVAGAFADLCRMEEEKLFQLSCGFGGGVGRMREICGAVSGMTLVADILYASGSIGKGDKDAQYARIRELAERFRRETGSIVCRELLGLEKAREESPVSAERTPEYYKKRPCVEMVALAASILEEYIAQNPPAL
ncbi:MAG: C-GCAxxG-C-C family protein [Victivallaceae bacterium]|nr:C-GCAxxG-C-C family protein [Victivallaceae bacterium]